MGRRESECAAAAAAAAAAVVVAVSEAVVSPGVGFQTLGKIGGKINFKTGINIIYTLIDCLRANEIDCATFLLHTIYVQARTIKPAVIRLPLRLHTHK